MERPVTINAGITPLIALAQFISVQQEILGIVIRRALAIPPAHFVASNVDRSKT